MAVFHPADRQYVTFKATFIEEEYSMDTLSHAKFGLIGEGRGIEEPQILNIGQIMLCCGSIWPCSDDSITTVQAKFGDE